MYTVCALCSVPSEIHLGALVKNFGTHSTDTGHPRKSIRSCRGICDGSPNTPRVVILLCSNCCPANAGSGSKRLNGTCLCCGHLPRCDYRPNQRQILRKKWVSDYKQSVRCIDCCINSHVCSESSDPKDRIVRYKVFRGIAYTRAKLSRPCQTGGVLRARLQSY